MNINSFKYVKDKGQIKLIVDTGVSNPERMNGFIFQVEASGCRLFFLLNELVVAERFLVVKDKGLLKTLLCQKVMRIEDHQQEPYAFIAINRRLVAKAPLSTKKSKRGVS
tara:strand:- start:1585 stop:1914 length:330 start_codon:yes stop_codon:yes gene_type:complete